MEYRKLGNTYAVRLDRGDEVVSSLTELARQENIAFADIRGIGAAGEVTVGIFETAKKEYHSTTYTGDFEITSLLGTISRQAEKPYLHLHITVCNPDKGIFTGGHLNRAVISATGEIIVTVHPGSVGRQFDDAIGLNLFSFA